MLAEHRTGISCLWLPVSHANCCRIDPECSAIPSIHVQPQTRGLGPSTIHGRVSRLARGCRAFRRRRGRAAVPPGALRRDDLGAGLPEVRPGELYADLPGEAVLQSWGGGWLKDHVHVAGCLFFNRGVGGKLPMWRVPLL